MPLQSKTPVGSGFLALWRQDESTDALLSGWSMSPAEQAFYDTITSPRRRREWLAARRMIRELFGPAVSTDYDAEGRPVLVGHEGHIGISHTNEWVVLYYSPAPCGVDIERCDRDFERTASRYASPAERAIPGLTLPLVWCLKEAAYKWARTPGLDFLRDIQIVTIDEQAHTAHLRLCGERTVTLSYQFLDGHCLAWTI